MTYASVPTLLSLDRYAKILGINPVHFAGAIVTDPVLFAYGSSCQDRWFQHRWQSQKYVSREDVAQKIAEVEEELALFVGYYPAPTWIESEPHNYPRDYDPLSWGSDADIRSHDKGIKLDFGRFILPGKRAVTVVSTGEEAVYSDEDADMFDETVTVSCATVVTDVNELKVYFPGHTEPEWEIRPARTKILAGGVVTFTFYTWQFIKPELNEAFPPGPLEEDQLCPIDISSSENLLLTVDVCREYTDTTQNGVTFYWEPLPGVVGVTLCPCCGGAGCPACSHYEQVGCLFVRNVELGIAGMNPAHYDAATAAWIWGSWDVCRAPDIVKANYYAGEVDKRFMSGATHEPLSNFWAIIIAEMATARLEKPFCACESLNEVQDELRVDLTYTTQGESRFVTQSVLNCPFGTHRGEVNAWLKLSKFVKKIGRVAVI